MRILVCGGRDFTDTDSMFSVLDRVSATRGMSWLIHGGCPTGADKIAGQWAEARRIPEWVFPPNWPKYGKAAGPIRNQQMIDEGKPNACVAFPGGRGTADMIARCKKAGIPVWEPMK